MDDLPCALSPAVLPLQRSELGLWRLGGRCGAEALWRLLVEYAKHDLAIEGRGRTWE